MRTTRCMSCTGPSVRLTTATPWTPGETWDMESSYWPLRRHIGWSLQIAGPRMGVAAITTEASSSMAGTMECLEQACQRCWHLLPLLFCMSDCYNQKKQERVMVLFSLFHCSFWTKTFSPGRVFESFWRHSRRESFGEFPFSACWCSPRHSHLHLKSSFNFDVDMPWSSPK